MTRFGYTLMTEQSGPRELVSYAVAAEQAGFDFEVMSDHFSPWLTEQGHAPYAWTTLGAVAQATERVGLMTYVTCPTLRYHPAVVAQKAATLQILAEGRFTLGLGSGENLNEHVVGEGWPAIAERQDMLAEAIEVIRGAAHRRARRPPRRLLPGRLRPHLGPARRRASTSGSPSAASARSSGSPRWPTTSWPPSPRPTSSSPGTASTAPRASARDARAVGQIPICWDPDEDAAVARAHEQFRWFGGGWSVNADLPTPAGFSGATTYVRPEDVAESIPCGPDLDKVVEAVSAYWEAGFTDVALVQIGDEGQDRFISEAAGPLLEKLRAAAP